MWQLLCRTGMIPHLIIGGLMGLGVGGMWWLTMEMIREEIEGGYGMGKEEKSDEGET